MFGISRFSRPRSSFERPVPLVLVDPDLTPDVTVCIRHEWIPYILGALSQLTLPTTWDTDDPEVLANQLQRVNLLISNFITPCGGEIDTCIDFPPYSSIVEYVPQDPFKQPGYIPTGYFSPPFVEVKSVNPLDGIIPALAALQGLSIGDVFVPTTSIGTGLADEKLPIIRIHVKGKGSVNVHLLNLLAGGSVVIWRDDNIVPESLGGSLRVVELNRDNFSLPPETAKVIIQEVKFDTDGDHTVHIKFVPVVDDSLTPPFRFGAGLRKIELCGFADAIEDVARDIADAIRRALTAVDLGEDNCMKIRVNPDNPCQIQALCEPTGEWELFYDPSACISSTVGVEAGQPAPFGTIAPGGCQSWNAVMRGSEQWLLPTPVKAGDTIQVSNAVGGIQAGLLDWRCPSGLFYVLGGCTGSPSNCSACPLTSKPKGRLICNINGTWYDAYNTTIIVPDSVTTPVDVYFQVNDDDVTGNSGSYSFTVKACAAQAEFSITYGDGSGATSVLAGDTITMSSTPTSGAPYHEIGFVLSACTNFTLNSISGYTPSSGGQPDGLAPGCGAWGAASNWFRGSTLPLVFTGKDRMDLVSDTPFNIRVKF